MLTNIDQVGLLNIHNPQTALLCWDKLSSAC